MTGDPILPDVTDAPAPDDAVVRVLPPGEWHSALSALRWSGRPSTNGRRVVSDFRACGACSVGIVDLADEHGAFLGEVAAVWDRPNDADGAPGYAVVSRPHHCLTAPSRRSP